MSLPKEFYELREKYLLELERDLPRIIELTHKYPHGETQPDERGGIWIPWADFATLQSCLGMLGSLLADRIERRRKAQEN